jgi:hypothetical protein
VTLGQLVAHTITRSRLERVKSALDVTIDGDVLVCLSKVVNRWEVEVLGNFAVPIISDIDELKRDLFSLFDVRKCSGS